MDRVRLKGLVLMFLLSASACAQPPHVNITAGSGGTFVIPASPGQMINAFSGSVQGTNYDWDIDYRTYQGYFRNNTNTAKAVLYQKRGYYFIYDISDSQMQWIEKPGQPAASSTLGGGCSSNTLDTQAIVSGATVLYPSAFCNTNITYQINSTMMKENYVLYGLPSIKDYLYLEYTGHVYFNKSLDICANRQCYRPSGSNDNFNTSGQISFQDQSTNKTLFYLTAPYIRDSAGHTSLGRYDVRGSNAQMIFELRINQSFLANATYPVYIDPTIVDQEEKRVEFYPDDQNYISAQLFKKVGGEWNTSISDLYVYFNTDKWKFGANDSANTGSEQYRYLVNTSLGFYQKPEEPYAFYTSTLYKLDMIDVCTAGCTISPINENSTSFTVDFTSDKTIDPYISPVPYSANVTYDLSAKDPGNWMGTNVIYAVGANVTGAVFLGGQNGIFGVYIPPNDTIYDLRSTVSSWLGTSQINTITVLTDKAYIAAAGGVFGVYLLATNKSSDLSATDPGNWIGTGAVYELDLDIGQQHMYVGVGGGKFGYYNTTSNVSVDLSNTDVGDWISNKNILALAANSTGAAFIGGQGGIFGVYIPGINVTYDLTATDPGNWWGPSNINHISVNLVTGIVYIGGDNSKWGYYNPGTNTTYSLMATDPGDWMSTNSGINAVAADKRWNNAYLAMQHGRLGKYSIADNTTYDLSATDPGNWMATSQLYDAFFDATNGLCYIGGQGGKFGVYSPYASVGNPIGCTNDSQCNVKCVDGMCCETVCNGSCERCASIPGNPSAWAGVNGTCSSITAAYDPDSECGAIGCSTPTAYFWGWSILSCYYRDNVTAANAMCSGTAACYTNSYYCPTQGQGSSYTSCDCTASEIACSGTTAGSCSSHSCSVPVAAISPQNPTQDGITTINCTFTPGFTATLSTAKCSFTNGAITRSNTTGNCVNNAGTITCAVNLWYYDSSGTWSVNASVSGVAQHWNDTTTFTYNTLLAYAIDKNVIDFGVLTLSTTQAALSNPLSVYNQGNVQINNLSIKGYQLEAIGDAILASRFNVTNVQSPISIIMVNDTFIQLNPMQIAVTKGANKTFNFYMNTPDVLSSGGYANKVPWVVYASN